jgi:hypothetical protein
MVCFFLFFFFFLKEADSNKRSVDKMVTRVLSDNKELLKDLVEDESKYEYNYLHLFVRNILNLI